MTKNQNTRGAHSHDCTKVQLRLTPDQIKVVKILAAVENIKPHRLLEKQLESFFRENHGKQIELQKTS